MGVDCGGCLLRFLLVSPGKSEMYPLSIAFCNVERLGEKRVAWEKAIISGAFVGSVTELA